MRAPATARSAALAAAVAVAVFAQPTAAAIKPPVPLWKLPAGSTNGTMLDAFANVTLKGGVFPSGPQVDIPLLPQWSTENMGPVLPWSNDRIKKQVPGCAPEQVHLVWYDTQDSGPSVLVSWATCALDGDASYTLATPSPPPQNTSAASSRVWIGTVPGVYDKSFDGVSYSYTVDSTSSLSGQPSGGGTYVSPIVHHTLLTGLVPGTKVFYKIDNAPQLPGGTTQGEPFFGHFRVPGGFPLKLAVGGDSGEVTNATISIDFAVQEKPDAFMLIGDYTYADQYSLDAASCFTTQQCAYLNGLAVPPSTFSPRWDSFFRLFQPLLARTPLITVPGNHEVEGTPGDAQTPSSSNGWANNQFFTRFDNYLARVPVPQTAAIARNGPTVADLKPITPGSPQGRGLYYVSEIPGVATIINLSTYNYGEQFAASDPQYIWLKGVLSRVNRVKTPWLIVQMHAGWYSLFNHWQETECMRQLYEPLLRLYSVDIVFSGHTHDTQRTFPMYNYARDETSSCSPTFIVTGAFGTNGGITTAWIDQWATPGVAATLGSAVVNSCPNNPSVYSPPNYAVTAPGQWGAGGSCPPPKIAASGDWCPSSQPPWSAFRNHAYGVGMLNILSPTKAVWAFYSQESAMFKPYDEVVITRADPVKCAQTPATQAAAATVGVPVADVLASSKAFNLTAAKADVLASFGRGAGGAAVDPKGAASGVVRGGADWVAAKLATANFTLGKLEAAWANKTGRR